jgi:hypothetical protein
MAKNIGSGTPRVVVVKGASLKRDPKTGLWTKRDPSPSHTTIERKA